MKYDFPIYSIAALGAAATFTSTWKQVRYTPSALPTPARVPYFAHWAHYCKGIAFADVAGTLWVEQSNDGATVHFQESFAVGAGLAGALAFNRRLYGIFVRLRYVNGAVAQATFSLTGMLAEVG